MAYKRSSKKINNSTRVTTTKSSRGTRNTVSTKSGSGRITQTHSNSWTKDGRLRQTSTRNNNGWVTRTSRILGSKPKRTGGRRSRKSKGDDILLVIILWLLFLPFKIMWWLLKKLFGK